MGESLFDSFICQGTNPQTVERTGDAQVFVNESKYKFTFSSGICGYDNAFAFSEEFFDDFELGYCRRVGFITFTLLYLTGNKGKDGRKNRQVLFVETLDAVGFGHGCRYQVPQCPSDGIAASFNITVFLVGCPNNASDFTSYARLFCYNDFHLFLLFGY